MKVIQKESPSFLMLSICGGGEDESLWIWASYFTVPIHVSGGADKNVIVFDKSSEQILATLKGHTKKVTGVVFHPSQVRVAANCFFSYGFQPISGAAFYEGCICSSPVSSYNVLLGLLDERWKCLPLMWLDSPTEPGGC